MNYFSLSSLGVGGTTEAFLWVTSVWWELCLRKVNLGSRGRIRAGAMLEGKTARKLLHLSKEELRTAHSTAIGIPVQGRTKNVASEESRLVFIWTFQTCSCYCYWSISRHFELWKSEENVVIFIYSRFLFFLIITLKKNIYIYFTAQDFLLPLII